MFRFALSDVCSNQNIQHTGVIHQICDLLQEAGVSEFSEWAEIILTCSLSEDVIEKAAAAVINSWWEVCVPRHVSIAATMLPHAQPPILRVQMPKFEPPPELGPLLTAIRENHLGELRLLLRHSHYTFTPSDDTLAILRGARYSVSNCAYQI